MTPHMHSAPNPQNSSLSSFQLHTATALSSIASMLISRSVINVDAITNTDGLVIRIPAARKMGRGFFRSKILATT